MVEKGEVDSVVDIESGRLEFGQALRAARNAKKLTQEELASRTSVNRDVITRLERGRQDVGLELARALADILDAPALIDQATTSPRAGTRYRAPVQRKDVLATLLSSRVVDRLVIVVADEIDIIGLLKEARLNPPKSVSIVFPTRKRQRELRGSSVRLETIGPSWDVQDQINRIFEATSVDVAAGGLGEDIKLYESDEVRLSFVLVMSSEGALCVTWPMLPYLSRDEADSLPAMASQESSFIQFIEDHVRQLQAHSPLTHLKAIVINTRTRGSGDRTHDLSMFFELGKTTESEVAESGDPELDAGFAVSLVIVHGVVQQPQRALGRRLLLPYDPITHTHELFATTVSYADFRQEDDEPARSTLDARSAINELEQTHPADPGAVGAEIFARAASRGILDEFGVSVPIERFVEIELPEDLWVVRKEAGLVPVIPRLFELDLSPTATSSDLTEEQSTWVRSRTELKMAFQRSPHVRAVGISDLTSREDEFNHFIRQAREFDDGWLVRTLEQLGITEK